MRWHGFLCCLLTVFSGGKAYSGSSSVWLSNNTVIASTSMHYKSPFQSLTQQPSTGTGTGTSYTIDSVFSVGLKYEGAIVFLPNLNLSHVPKLGFSQAVIHFPNGVGVFTSPTTIESRSFILSEQLNWNILSPRSSLVGFDVDIGYRHIFNYDSFRLGNWEFVEKPHWGEVFYQAQAHFPLHKLIGSDNTLKLVLSIERSSSYTLPQVRVEARF
tara:strand:- start:116 stop:757 length:642 start_codon:yes stop_codon:yes gene_type:complete